MLPSGGHDRPLLQPGVPPEDIRPFQTGMASFQNGICMDVFFWTGGKEKKEQPSRLVGMAGWKMLVSWRTIFCQKFLAPFFIEQIIGETAYQQGFRNINFGKIS